MAIATGLYEIPANTPVELSGGGSDNDNGDVLTYSWEQQDSGSASNVDVDTGNNAIFRAFEPVSTPTRIFPTIEKILGTSTAKGEVLPSSNRQLNFRLVVRDQKGGVDDSSLTLIVTNTSATGFRMTAPNVSQSYSPGEAVVVTWDRAGTHQSPINCANVALSFSTDGGQTFGAGGEQIFSNTGSAVATIPANATTTGRFKLKCVGNVFFDISDADLTVANAPEISVSGNSVEIADGDTSPSQTDDTDFGDVGVSQSHDHTFVISNPGSQSLLLTGNPRVTLSGPNVDQFVVTQFPGTPVAAGGTRTFIIAFEPDSSGLKQATISIANNDSDENPYNFTIQGRGTNLDMSVLGNSVEIGDGDSSPSVADGTDFGAVAVDGGSAQRSFDIMATAGDRQLTANPRVQISGTNASDFSVTTDAASVIGEGSTTSFTIEFNPSGVGQRSATVVIPNNDPDAYPYDFAIQGAGSGADLSLDLTDVSDPLAPGESLAYGVSVTNLGPATIQGTTVEISLDGDLVFTGGAGCSQSIGQPVICQTGALNANQNVQLIVSTAVNTGARGSVTSSATVVNTGFDPNTSNNADTEDTTIELIKPSVSLSLSPNPVEVAANTWLRISVDNTVSQVDVSGLGFNLVLPSGVLVATNPQIADGCRT
ncbi:MAG: choice-of-anchor D domain-containing protein [Gammaproteobacteria bacterium]